MADILQKIKVIAETAAATRNLKDVKSAQDSIPKQIKVATQNYDKALTNLKTNFIALTAVATATFAVLYKGFVGIGEDVKSVNQMNTAIQTMGISADVSAKQLFSYFQTLQTGIGQSASTLGTLAQSFISAGARSQQQIKKLTEATIGLAERSGISTQEAGQKIRNAMLGNVKGLKQFGIAATQGQSKQQLLNEALRQGAIAFANIDPDSPARLISRLKQSFDNMIKSLAANVAHVLTPVFNFIIKNMDTIGKILTTGAIYTGLKSAVRLFHSIKLEIASSAALLKTLRMEPYIVGLKTMNDLWQQNGDLTAEGWKNVQYLSDGLAAANRNLSLTQKILLSIKTIFSTTNIILLAITIATQALIANWDKIKASITGVSVQQKKLNDATSDAVGNYKNYQLQVNKTISSLYQLAGKQNKTNQQKYKMKGLIDSLNTKYPELVGSTLSYNDSLTTLQSKLSGVNAKLKQQKQRMIDLAIFEVNKQQIIQYAKQLNKLLPLRDKILSDPKNIKFAVDTTRYNALMKKSFKDLNDQQKTFIGKYTFNKPFSGMQPWESAVLGNYNIIKKKMDDLANTQGNLFDKLFKPSDYTAPASTTAQTGVIKSDTYLPDKKSKAESFYIPSLLANLKLLSSEFDYISNDLTNISKIDPTANIDTSKLSKIKDEYDAVRNSLLSMYNKQLSRNIELPITAETILNITNLKQSILDLQRATLRIPDFTGDFGSALEDISDEIDPLIERFVMLKDANPFKEMPVAMFDELGSAMGSFISTFSNGLGAVLTQGANFSKQMKYIWRDLANNIISQLTRILVKMLAVFAIKTIMNLIMPGSGAAAGTAVGDFIPSPSIASVGPVNTITNTVGTSISYMGRNPIADKLDEVIEAINNFTPVQTQVIDLPTLSSANRIGSAMTLRMS